jgi:hypothetical protein
MASDDVDPRLMGDPRHHHHNTDLARLQGQLALAQAERDRAIQAVAEMRRLVRTGTITRVLGQLNLRLREKCFPSGRRCATCDCPLVFPEEFERKTCEICHQFDWLAT